jgi:hypothetical protein
VTELEAEVRCIHHTYSLVDRRNLQLIVFRAAPKVCAGVLLRGGNLHDAGFGSKGVRHVKRLMRVLPTNPSHWHQLQAAGACSLHQEAGGGHGAMNGTPHGQLR